MAMKRAPGRDGDGDLGPRGERETFLDVAEMEDEDTVESPREKAGKSGTTRTGTRPPTPKKKK
jgi:hypothetical protein